MNNELMLRTKTAVVVIPFTPYRLKTVGFRHETKDIPDIPDMPQKPVRQCPTLLSNS
jgi:hypothetical protein